MKKLEEFKRGLGASFQLSKTEASRLKGGGNNGRRNHGRGNGRGNGNDRGNVPPPPPPPGYGR